MSDDESQHRSGTWLGDVEGLRIREPGPDADGPLLEILGEEGMAATQFSKEEWVQGLTEASAEIQTWFDEEAMLE